VVELSPISFTYAHNEDNWGVMCVYDYVLKETITESISFKLSNEPMKVAFDPPSHSRGLVIIVRLERPFDGDMLLGSEKYTSRKTSSKPASGRQNQNEKYRQPLAWTYTTLHSSEGEVEVKEIPIQLFRCESGKVHDEDIFNAISIYEKAQTSRKLKILPAQATIKVHSEEVNPGDEGFRRLRNMRKDSSVLKLPSFDNTLYVSPLSVSLGKYSDARNIVCHTQLVVYKSKEEGFVTLKVSNSFGLEFIALHGIASPLLALSTSKRDYARKHIQASTIITALHSSIQKLKPLYRSQLQASITYSLSLRISAARKRQR
jgi:hypothetical protein